MSETIWKDWTREDWENASYCEDCGLPLLEIETEPGIGQYTCVYCTLKSDEADVQSARIGELESIADDLLQCLESEGHGPDGCASTQRYLAYKAEHQKGDGK